jgi:hypothetical protein
MSDIEPMVARRPDFLPRPVSHPFRVQHPGRSERANAAELQAELLRSVAELEQAGHFVDLDALATLLDGFPQ